MTGPLEIACNSVNALSIFLAGRNSVHTWWTGIVGCLLFAWQFTVSQLYADATLQVFFVVTSVIGWVNWIGGSEQSGLPIRRTGGRVLALMALGGLAVAAVYGWMLHRYTDAYAPVPDSLVLVLSVIAQLLLMHRRLESWWGWLMVNTIAVPLFFSRGLYLTAALYAVFWVNAFVSLRHWRRLMPAPA
jgi:nicotinamide mononucleotide transporter